jgi:hypothetical protein
MTGAKASNLYGLAAEFDRVDALTDTRTLPVIALFEVCHDEHEDRA